VYLRRAKFSVWFSGVGTGWCLYNGEAVENCVPEKGEILRLAFGCGSWLVLVQRESCGEFLNLRRAKFSVWFSGAGPDWCLVQQGRCGEILNRRRAKFSVWFSDEGPAWCLYNGEAVEKCVPEKGGILRLMFGRGSLLVLVQRGSCGELCT
jgi:hypothetical protein